MTYTATKSIASNFCYNVTQDDINPALDQNWHIVTLSKILKLTHAYTQSF